MEKFITSLSIVIPIFNASSYIEKLLERIDKTKNLLSGAKVNLIEVICVCDEPIDNSFEIIKNLQEKYKYLRVIELSSNTGQHLATSAGIVSSIGDWVCTLDEDLQHDPMHIIELLITSTKNSKDLVYAKSIKGTHRKYFTRDLPSKLAKNIVSLFTGINLRIISSFRLIRGNVARSCATSMDKYQYLDNLLFYLTSEKRRENVYLKFFDKRPKNSSGYNFISLLSHFFRTLYSSEIGARRFFLILFIPIIFISILIGLYLFIISQYKSAYLTVPGWTSLFVMEILILLILGLFFTFSIKMYSIIALRSLSITPYLTIDRSSDKNVYKNLKINFIKSEKY